MNRQRFFTYFYFFEPTTLFLYGAERTPCAKTCNREPPEASSRGCLSPGPLDRATRARRRVRQILLATKQRRQLPRTLADGAPKALCQGLEKGTGLGVVLRSLLLSKANKLVRNMTVTDRSPRPGTSIRSSFAASRWCTFTGKPEARAERPKTGLLGGAVRLGRPDSPRKAHTLQQSHPRPEGRRKNWGPTDRCSEPCQSLPARPAVSLGGPGAKGPSSRRGRRCQARCGPRRQGLKRACDHARPPSAILERKKHKRTTNSNDQRATHREMAGTHPGEIRKRSAGLKPSHPEICQTGCPVCGHWPESRRTFKSEDPDCDCTCLPAARTEDPGTQTRSSPCGAPRPPRRGDDPRSNSCHHRGRR